ncbi:MAG: SIS domain-containing protein [Acidobacteriota bacterium]
MRKRYSSIIDNAIRDHVSLVEAFFKEGLSKLVTLGDAIASSLEAGGKVLLFGNGGSAADAQHIAAELVNRLEKNRKAIPAIALTTDSSIITSIANDISFRAIFARQIEALGKAGDIAIGISTSGKSRNVYLGLKTASRMGLATAALLGRDGGEIKSVASIPIIVRGKDTQRIQEVHAIIGHLICQIVETRLIQGKRY